MPLYNKQLGVCDFLSYIFYVVCGSPYYLQCSLSLKKVDINLLNTMHIKIKTLQIIIYARKYLPFLGYIGNLTIQIRMKPYKI